MILDERARQILAKRAWPELGAREIDGAVEAISQTKNRTADGGRQTVDDAFVALFKRYEASLAESHALDFDDLISRTVELLMEMEIAGGAGAFSLDCGG